MKSYPQLLRRRDRVRLTFIIGGILAALSPLEGAEALQPVVNPQPVVRAMADRVVSNPACLATFAAEQNCSACHGATAPKAALLTGSSADRTGLTSVAANATLPATMVPIAEVREPSDTGGAILRMPSDQAVGMQCASCHRP